MDEWWIDAFKRCERCEGNGTLGRAGRDDGAKKLVMRDDGEYIECHDCGGSGRGQRGEVCADDLARGMIRSRYLL